MGIHPAPPQARFPFSPRRIAVMSAAALALATFAVAPARAAGQAPASTLDLCRSRQHVTVRDAAGTAYIIKNDNYGGQAECISIQGQGPNFTVTDSAAASKNKEPQAYPFILRGCSWGTCSPHSGLPREVSALGTPSATWDTSQRAGGMWDAAFDIWFGTHPMTTGQVTGTEMMIWLNARGIKVARHTRKVVVDHTQWYLLHWHTCHGGACWEYTQFRRVHPVTGVRDLRLAPFISHEEAHGWIRPQWWLEAVEAGFELWRGGTGLATRWFWVRP